MQQVTTAADFPSPPGDVLAYLERPAVLRRLLPAWSGLRAAGGEGWRTGGGFALDRSSGLGQARWRFTVAPTDLPPGWEADTGDAPFRFLRHRVRLHELPEGHTRLEDTLLYRLRGGWLAEAFAAGRVADRAVRLFRWRQRQVGSDLADRERWPGLAGQRILVAGASGMAGTHLRDYLEALGAETVPLVRSPADQPDGPLRWNPDAGWIEREGLDGFDAWIHLGGVPIAQRWTGRVREAIYQSRMKSTRLLVATLGLVERKPRTFLCASGISYYGNRPLGEPATEETPSGKTYLARVARHWEHEAAHAADHGVRWVSLRTAVVLDPSGGALAKLLPIFRLGMGGPVASGRQAFPWIGIEDYSRACAHLLAASSLEGPVNLVAPELVDNRTLARSLAGALHRPAFLPVPGPAVRVGFGEMGRETLLGGTAAVPAALGGDGFTFRHPDLASLWPDALGLDGGPFQ